MRKKPGIKTQELKMDKPVCLSWTKFNNSMSKPAPILVAMSTCNLRERLPAVLAGFEAQTTSEFRLVILDDASTDGTSELLEQYINSISFTAFGTPQRLGRSRNRNRVLELLAGESLILFWDGDMIPAPDLIQTHLKFHAEHPEGAALYGRVHFDGNSRLANYLNSRPLEMRIPHIQFPLAVPGRKLLTSNFSLPSTSFFQSGGFDTGFHYWGGEDMEFGLRLAAQNIPLYYNPEAKGFHPPPGSVQAFVARHWEYGRYNLPLIVEKFPEIRSQLRLDILNSLWGRFLVRSVLIPDAAMEYLPFSLITAAIFQRYAQGYLASLQNA